MRNQLCVTADIEYLDGTLAGLEIPAGFTVPVSSPRRAVTVARQLAQLRKWGEPIAAAVTGNKYRIVGRIEIRAAI